MDLSSRAVLDLNSRSDLMWWATNVERVNGKGLTVLSPDITIFSDASLSGWGAVMNSVSAKGPWPLEDQGKHINELELLAAFFALKAFTSSSTGISVCLMLSVKRRSRLEQLEALSNRIFRIESAVLGLRAPHHSIGTSSVGRWIKAVLGKAGVYTSTFSAHSTRGAAASNAAAGGVSTDVILRTGSWRSESTFSRFYRRQVETTSVASTLTG